jgi:hypothetical protein
MAVAWSTRRQALYYIVGFLALAILLVAAWRVFFVHTPTCEDQIQNGNETGIDCGGSCALICSGVAKAPTVLWARSFETSPQTYSSVAYIQNNNVSLGAGAKKVRYSFQILDEKNILIAEREGVIDLPPAQTVPIVEQGITVGTRAPARTFFSFADEPIVWKKVPADALQKLRITHTSPYENNRISATIMNDSLEDAKKVTIVAVLFDAQGVARAASKSTLASLARKSSETVVFTWPGEFRDIARAEITILPSF